MSRVHVSSRSGGWRIDGSAGPQPERGGWEGGGGLEGRWLEKKGRRERRKDSMQKQAGSWLAQPAREGQSFTLK